MEVTVIDDKGAVPPEDDQVQTDSNFVRSNMYGLVQQGQDALHYALELAKQSDSPRAFEVVGTLMKNLSDMNMQLLDAHEKKAKLLQKEKTEPSATKVVNNSIVFSGSTAELHKMISNMKKESE